MNINYTKGGLAHAWKKHDITKNRIEASMSKGIARAFKDSKYNSLVMFTNDNLVVVIDYITHKFKTAFVPMDRYIHDMERHCQELTNIK